VDSTADGFLSDVRLLRGPWASLERDVARLMSLHGFESVRLVGGSGDGGADILGVKSGDIWVVQCKHTTTTPPPRTAISEVVAAGAAYRAQRLLIACSRQPTESFLDEVRALNASGTRLDVAGPGELLELMRMAPVYPPTRKPLRDYQSAAVAQLEAALTETGKGLVVLATGLGKTVVMAELVAHLFESGQLPSGRVLVLAHTRDIVSQVHQASWQQLPSWVETHQLGDGEVPSFWDGVVFATVQSAASRLDSLPHFDCVLVDEAHHVGAETFLRVLDRLQPKLLCGVTATPWRGDGYQIEQIFGPALIKIGIEEGLRRGFLTEVDYRLMCDNVDWEFVQRESRHRYSVSQLNRRLLIPTRDNEAARQIADVFRTERRKAGLVFSPSIVHAHAFTATLRQFGLRVEVVSSEMTGREREVVIAQFRRGTFDCLATVDMFNEGVDVPDVDLVVFMRATHSRRIFVQQLGRGLRVSPGKDRVVVLDFVSDLRRLAEVLTLDKAVRGEEVERIGLGGRLVQFSDSSAGSFLREWMLDQADLFVREDDPTLEIPSVDFPNAGPGAFQ
jgi:superfamily II DNA or RNA helicase